MIAHRVILPPQFPQEVLAVQAQAAAFGDQAALVGQYEEELQRAYAQITELQEQGVGGRALPTVRRQDRWGSALWRSPSFLAYFPALAH